jgi:hypothetical protein
LRKCAIHNFEEERILFSERGPLFFSPAEGMGSMAKQFWQRIDSAESIEKLSKLSKKRKYLVYSAGELDCPLKGDSACFFNSEFKAWEILDNSFRHFDEIAWISAKAEIGDYYLPIPPIEEEGK